MEKYIYPLWKRDDQSADDLCDLLLDQLAPQLLSLDDVHTVRVAVADSAVADAAGRRMESHAPLPNAVVSLGVENASAGRQWEPLIDAEVSRCAGYRVSESEPLVTSDKHPAASGERLYGMCHVVFMRKPVNLKREDWLKIWKGSHTQVAIDTQSTFGYRQNVVEQTLTPDTLYFDAIVEENFPPQAMTSDHAFYNTDGDEGLLKQRMTAMMESCARFIDFEHIDVLPTSEYVFTAAD
jgi:hypothetical protein